MIDLESFRWVVELLITALAIILFWNFRSLKSEVVQVSAVLALVDKDLQQYKLHVSEHYATSSDMKSFIDAVFKKLDRIEDKLDKKADKT